MCTDRRRRKPRTTEHRIASNLAGPSPTAITPVAPWNPSRPSDGAKRTQGVGRLSVEKVACVKKSWTVTDQSSESGRTSSTAVGATSRARNGANSPPGARKSNKGSDNKTKGWKATAAPMSHPVLLRASLRHRGKTGVEQTGHGDGVFRVTPEHDVVERVNLGREDHDPASPRGAQAHGDRVDRIERRRA